MTARTTLERFLTTMSRWDVEWYGKFDASDMAPDVVEEARAALVGIFTQFVADDADRRNDLVDAVAPSAPSQYADAAYEITAVSEDTDTALYEVQLTTGLKARYRYYLVRRVPGWRIVRREIRRGSTQSWAGHAI